MNENENVSEDMDVDVCVCVCVNIVRACVMFIVPQCLSASLQLTDICLPISRYSLNGPITASAATQEIPLCCR